MSDDNLTLAGIADELDKLNIHSSKWLGMECGLEVTLSDGRSLVVYRKQDDEAIDKRHSEEVARLERQKSALMDMIDSDYDIMGVEWSLDQME